MTSPESDLVTCGVCERTIQEGEGRVGKEHPTHWPSCPESGLAPDRVMTSLPDPNDAGNKNGITREPVTARSHSDAESSPEDQMRPIGNTEPGFVSKSQIRRVAIQENWTEARRLEEQARIDASSSNDLPVRDSESELPVEAQQDIGRLALHTKIIELGRERDELRAEVARLAAGLTRIRNLDYRGHREEGSTIAYRVLDEGANYADA